MPEFAFRSATALVADIKAGRTSSRALLEIFLQRIDRYNPSLNAVICERRDHARQRADAADAAWQRGEDWGPLHGLPMTVKESYNVEGLPTTWGHPAFKDNVAAADAVAVRHLLDAGAIVFGKTNVPIDLADFQSYNAVYGTTNNPWDQARTPGGSSGGSAAALAAGLTGLEIGTDIGGSIRNPAHFCGVFGHKPSFGLVSLRGHGLKDALTAVDISVGGPLARSAQDLELALNLIAGPNPLDAAGVKYQLPVLTKPVQDLRIAVWNDVPLCPSSDEVRQRVDKVAQVLAQAGARVDAHARPGFTAEHSHAVFFGLLHSAMSSRMPQAAFDALVERAGQLEAGDHSERAQMLRLQTMRHQQWASLNEQRACLRDAWRVFFETHDFLITPIMPTSAFQHDHGNFGGRTIDIDGRKQPYFTQTFWAGLAGVCWLPATIVPTGPDANGLPIGVQIIGPMYGDLQTIQLAQKLEQMGFAFQPPPAFA